MHSPYQDIIRELMKKMLEKNSVGNSSENKTRESNVIYNKTEFQFTKSHMN